MLKAQEHLEIEVEFIPNLTDPNFASKQIDGYLRLRSSAGFNLRRVQLLAYNAPLLQVSMKTLDFGFPNSAISD